MISDSEVYQKRQDEKVRRAAYREKARLIDAGTSGQWYEITIPDHAHVHEVEDGAFVDAVIFIPKEDISG